MQRSFAAALARLLAHEGGYSDHPVDPGGPTKYGVTLADYRRYAKPDATAADVRAMRVDEAKAIYRARYWNALSCDELAAGLDYALFDYGVNSGTARAARALRRLLGIAAGDSVDAATRAAIAGRNPAELIAALCDERLAFLRRLPTWPTFGRGWARRVAEVRASALAMAAGGQEPLPKSATRRNAGAAGGVIVAGGAAAGAHAFGARAETVFAIAAAIVVIVVAVWLVSRRRGAQLGAKAL